jgi:Phage replication protein CRI
MFMVDTIVIRLHNLRKYTQVVKSLNLYNNNGFTNTIGKMSMEEFLEFIKTKEKIASEKVDLFQDKRTGNFILKSQVGKQLNSSHHYSFAYYINFVRDFIEFNFSIPKYQFGTNILMFIEHDNDKEFQMFSGTTLEHNIKKSFSLFSKFIPNFFKREFVFCNIDLKDLEINRIDFCYNQVFNSREEALLYLEYQKKRKKKHARNEDGVMRDYTTSLMYKTRRYSAKIYHKGTEYEVHDKKEHIKYNIEKGKEYFKTDAFQNFSDRILRYELTFRSNYLNYLHKRHIFRKTCNIWKLLYKGFLMYEFIQEYNDNLSRKIAKINDKKLREEYLIKHPYKRTTQNEKNSHKIVSETIGKSRRFMIETDIESQLFNFKSVPGENYFVLFSRDLYNLCLKKLIEFINEYQIKELPPLEIVRNKIQEYNKIHKTKLPLAEMTHFYRNLIKHGSFKDASKYSDYSKATRYRYIERFSLIGITEKSIKPIDRYYGIPNAPLDFKRYHFTIMDKYHLLRGLKIPDIRYAF